MNATCQEVYLNGVSALEAAGVENAGADALHLLLSTFGFSNTEWLLKRGEPADTAAVGRYCAAVRSRAEGTPLQYILRTQPFLGYDYQVGEGVLIPRPETETLAQLCIERTRSERYRTVFDLCAGSGCIGLSIARYCPQTSVYLFEKYDPALYYLYKNIGEDVRGRVHVIAADILCGMPLSLPVPQLIVSNPPYIPSAELSGLQEEVRREPATALDGGADGMDFYRIIAREWFPRLAPGGVCLLECGEGQARTAAETLFNAHRTQIIKDTFGVDRFLRIQR